MGLSPPTRAAPGAETISVTAWPAANCCTSIFRAHTVMLSFFGQHMTVSSHPPAFTMLWDGVGQSAYNDGRRHQVRTTCPSKPLPEEFAPVPPPPPPPPGPEAGAFPLTPPFPPSPPGPPPATAVAPAPPFWPLAVAPLPPSAAVPPDPPPPPPPMLAPVLPKPPVPPWCVSPAPLLPPIVGFVDGGALPPWAIVMVSALNSLSVPSAPWPPPAPTLTL